MKVIAVLPAYNVAKTLVRFLWTLPKGVLDEVILIDDCSQDDTLTLAKKQKGITVFRTPRNLGYGGNLKMCITEALRHGADVVIEIHPDGEYGTDGIVPALGEIQKGAALVLGNRFAGGLRGMYWSKYIVTRLLTTLGNIVLQTNIPDLHQGFRVYTRTLLETINWRATRNDYLFSFEIIVQTVYWKLPIASVPVTAHYEGKKRGAPWGASVRYVLGTLVVMVRFLLGRFRPPQVVTPCPFCHTEALVYEAFREGSFSVLQCSICMNAYTVPQPQSMGRYYPATYHQVPGILGRVRDFVFSVLQKRRVRIVKAYVQCGDVLDVGSGSGMFGRQLGNAFHVTNIDPYYRGNGVLTHDIFTLKTRKRFDAVVFWESLEHVFHPAAVMTKAVSFLKPGGFLCVEYPRWESIQAKWFGKHWFHTDVPRHLFHFSDRGLSDLAVSHGMTIERSGGIFAPEYAPLGFLFSALNALGLGSIKFWFSFLGILLIPLSCVEYLTGQSPVGLLIAKKEDTM